MVIGTWGLCVQTANFHVLTHIKEQRGRHTIDAMAFCLSTLPKTAQKEIDDLLLHLRRLDLVKRKGGTPTALLMKGLEFYLDRVWDGDGFLYTVTFDRYVRHEGLGSYFRKYLKYLQDPCGDCQHGRPCKRSGDCTTVHGFCLNSEMRIARTTGPSFLGR